MLLLLLMLPFPQNDYFFMILITNVIFITYIVIYFTYNKDMKEMIIFLNQHHRTNSTHLRISKEAFIKKKSYF